jgi:hypothetical protein
VRKRLVTAAVVFALVALWASASGGDPRPSVFEKSIRVGSAVVALRIERGPYKPPKDRPDLVRPAKFNGQPALGGLPHDPKSRLARFDLTWDGRTVAVPQRLYENCFEPDLRSREARWSNHGGILLTPSESGDSLLVEMDATWLACCGYTVTWVLRSDGRHSRFIDSSIP